MLVLSFEGTFDIFVNIALHYDYLRKNKINDEYLSNVIKGYSMVLEVITNDSDFIINKNIGVDKKYIYRLLNVLPLFRDRLPNNLELLLKHFEIVSEVVL